MPDKKLIGWQNADFYQSKNVNDKTLVWFRSVCRTCDTLLVLVPQEILYLLLKGGPFNVPQLISAGLVG